MNRNRNYAKGRVPKSPKGGKSKKFDSRSKRTYGDDAIDESGSRHNDVSWYAVDNQILNDAARLPYNIPVGLPYSRHYLGQVSGTDYAEPGVLTQFVMPNLGYLKDPHDPANVAAQGLYSFIRHMNSGSRNYDPTDLMIYIGTMDSIFYVLSWCTRIFATLVTYHQGNRYLPKMLLEAQQLDADDFINNYPTFRANVNLRIAKVGSLLVPDVMPIFKRHAWLFSNYYIEGGTVKDQIYQYAPMGAYVFQLDSDGAGMLKAFDIRRSESEITVAGLLNTLDMMIDAIFLQEDFGLISGDIEKAYKDHVLRLAYLPDMASINYAYDENVLLQFKNAKTHSINRDPNSTDHEFLANFFDIHQSTNKDYLIMDTPLAGTNGFRDGLASTWVTVPPTQASTKHALVMKYVNLELSKPSLLTSPHDEVGADENMVMTRGTMAYQIGSSTGLPQQYYPVDYAFGSEWYGSFTITYTTKDIVTNIWSTHCIHAERVVVMSWNDQTTDQNIFTQENTISRLQAMLSRFKFAPEVKILGIYMDTTQTPYGVDTDIDSPSVFEVANYTVQDYVVIKGMHNAAILSEFNIPRIAVIS